jgi:predicted nuclease of predicted toxin-antitoxin system
VKFVVDYQLPPALARFLETQGHIASHVRDLGLKTAGDAVIWRRAESEDLVVVSKDEDFFFMATPLMRWPDWYGLGWVTVEPAFYWKGFAFICRRLLRRLKLVRISWNCAKDETPMLSMNPWT